MARFCSEHGQRRRSCMAQRRAQSAQSLQARVSQKRCSKGIERFGPVAHLADTYIYVQPGQRAFWIVVLVQAPTSPRWVGGPKNGRGICGVLKRPPVPSRLIHPIHGLVEPVEHLSGSSEAGAGCQDVPVIFREPFIYPEKARPLRYLKSRVAIPTGRRYFPHHECVNSWDSR